jgi:biotin carboxylase
VCSSDLYVIPPHYDSLIAKVLAWRPTRDEACDTLLRALREMQVEGVRTTIPLFLSVLRHAEFRAGRVDTGYLDTYREELFRF